MIGVVSARSECLSDEEWLGEEDADVWRARGLSDFKTGPVDPQSGSKKSSLTFKKSSVGSGTEETTHQVLI